MGRMGLWGNNGMGAAPQSPANTTTETSSEGTRESESNRDICSSEARGVTAGTTQVQQQQQQQQPSPPGQTLPSTSVDSASRSAHFDNNNNNNNNNNHNRNSSEAHGRDSTSTRRAGVQELDRKQDEINKDRSCTTTATHPTNRACFPGDNMVSSSAATITARARRPQQMEKSDYPDSDIMPMPTNPEIQQEQQHPQEPGAYSDTGTSLQRAPKLQYSLVGSLSSVESLQRHIALTEEEEQDIMPEQKPAATTSREGGGDSNGKILEDVSSSQLVVASMVAEHHDTPTRPSSLLPVARESSDADLIIQRQKEDDANNKKRICFFFVAGAGFLLLVITAIVAALAMAVIHDTDGRDDSAIQSTSASPTMTPSARRPLPPMQNLELLYSELPETTKESLYNSNSPQYEAWGWLLNHPNVTTYPEWRKKQIFAMATFFYSFEGPNWPDTKRWMDVTISECSWVLTELEVTYWAHQSNTIFGPNAYSAEDIQPCNEHGELHNLGLTNIFLPTDVKPTIPPEIALLSSIKLFGIVYSQIGIKLSDLLVPELVQLTNLENLNLQSSGVSGTIPKILGQLLGLRHLTLGENQLTSSIPLEITRMTSLEYFNINAVEGVTGTIPTDLGLLTRLTGLIIFETSVNGPIPSELGMLSNIRELGFSGSRLTGSIPSELGSWTNVEELWIRDNALRGSLPSELGLMTNCVQLVLGNHHDLDLQGAHLNDFFGSLPMELWRLLGLEALDLPNLPNLSGNIPTDTMSKLTLLRLEGSPHLTGTIPEEICHLQEDRAAALIGPALDFDCSDMLCGCDCKCADEYTNETNLDGWQWNHSLL